MWVAAPRQRMLFVARQESNQCEKLGYGVSMWTRTHDRQTLSLKMMLVITKEDIPCSECVFNGTRYCGTVAYVPPS